VGASAVVLQLMPQQRRFVGARGVEGQSVFSEVQGMLGEWLPIGETRQQQTNSEQGLFSRSSGGLEQTYTVWIKVDLP
jgi:hypothetical protein